MFSPNSIAWPVVFFGCVAAGLRVTLANSGYTKTELAWQWTDSKARVVFVAEELLGVVRGMFNDLGISREESERRIVIIKDEWLDAASGRNPQGMDGGQSLLRLEELLGLGRVTEEEKFDGKQADETVLLCYSSGTTGKAKGVETTHRNLTSVLNMSHPLFPEFQFGRDVVLGILPFYHIFGMCLHFHTVTCPPPLPSIDRYTPALFSDSAHLFRNF
jgi:acyl-CoA synthetase (AMP-forming)/AMP-acid ligase II